MVAVNYALGKIPMAKAATYGLFGLIVENLRQNWVHAR